MFNFGANGELKWNFDGGDLLQGETDGSSYMNGGLRVRRASKNQSPDSSCVSSGLAGRRRPCCVLTRATIGLFSRLRALTLRADGLWILGRLVLVSCRARSGLRVVRLVA